MQEELDNKRVDEVSGLQELVTEKEGNIEQMTVQIQTLQGEVDNLTDFQVRKYHKFSVIFMGSGWPMFSENTLMLYQQDLELGPFYYEIATGDRLRVAQFPIDYFAKQL